jgi:hypothetical protein
MSKAKNHTNRAAAHTARTSPPTLGGTSWRTRAAAQQAAAAARAVAPQKTAAAD